MNTKSNPRPKPVWLGKSIGRSGRPISFALKASTEQEARAAASRMWGTVIELNRAPLDYEYDSARFIK